MQISLVFWRNIELRVLGLPLAVGQFSPLSLPFFFIFCSIFRATLEVNRYFVLSETKLGERESTERIGLFSEFS